TNPVLTLAQSLLELDGVDAIVADPGHFLATGAVTEIGIHAEEGERHDDDGKNHLGNAFVFADEVEHRFLPDRTALETIRSSLTLLAGRNAKAGHYGIPQSQGQCAAHGPAIPQGCAAHCDSGRKKARGMPR